MDVYSIFTKFYYAILMLNGTQNVALFLNALPMCTKWQRTDVSHGCESDMYLELGPRAEATQF